MGLSKQVIIRVFESPKWGYPDCNLLITLLTKSHDPPSKKTIPLVTLLLLLALLRKSESHDPGDWNGRLAERTLADEGDTVNLARPAWYRSVMRDRRMLCA